MTTEQKFYATYRDGYYVVMDRDSGKVVRSDPGHYKRYRDGYLWDYAAVSEADRLNEEIAS